MTATKITAFDVEAETNQLLHGLLPDRFTTGKGWFDPAINAWRVSVVLAYPRLGSIGAVGEVIVSASADEIISHTSVTEMKERAYALYEQHREAIEAAFLSARNA